MASGNARKRGLEFYLPRSKAEQEPRHWKRLANSWFGGIESRCCTFCISIWKWLDTRISKCVCQVISCDAMYPQWYVVCLPRRGNRHGQFTDSLADRGIQGYRIPNILSWVSHRTVSWKPTFGLTCTRELAARRAKGGTENPDMSDVWDGLRRKARDHARNPMQWDGSQDAGFSFGKTDVNQPWMRVHDDYKEWNVAKQQNDESSVLTFWKRMIAFRKKHLSCVSWLINPETGQPRSEAEYEKLLTGFCRLTVSSLNYRKRVNKFIRISRNTNRSER